MGSKVIGVIALVAILAAIGDIVRNPSGSQAAFSGTNSLLSNAYNAAGGYPATTGSSSA